MRILYVARLFSGLETSLAERRWLPTGVPTAYKLIEALDRSAHDPMFVFTAKGFGSDWSDPQDRIVSVVGLRNPVRILASHREGEATKLGRYFREFRQAQTITRLVKSEQPDLVYVGNANVWTGAWIARRFGTPVVFRVMGVYPAMRSALSRSGVNGHVLRWAYRAPFAGAIVTQDGSGVEPWLDAALDSRVPRYLLVNGVDLGDRPASPHAQLATLPDGRTKVLFIGRLEPHKGADVFIAAFLAAWRREPHGLYAIVIGTGPQLESLRAQVVASGAGGSVAFIERLPHAQIIEAHARSDVYVSLNRYGNLSNSNLEAMKAGQCMIIPASQPSNGIDVMTDRLVPPEAALRIPSAYAAAELSDALLALHRAPERRQAMRAAMLNASGFVPTWDERLDCELKLLESLACRARAA